MRKHLKRKPRPRLEDFEDLIQVEVRKIGPIAGHDLLDVIQEMRMTVHGCLPRIRGNRGRVYVRTSIRNALLNLKRAATARHRMPHDRRGRMLPTMADVDELPIASSSKPEEEVAARELCSFLWSNYARSNRPRLPLRERKLLERAFIEGVVSRHDADRLEQARCRAEGILSNLLHRVEISSGGESMVEKKRKLKHLDIPECHAMGSDPVGYETDKGDAQPCQDCQDKFTCLPDSIRVKLIKTDLSIDPEAKEVYEGRMLITIGRQRVSKRLKLRESGEKIPTDLRYDVLPGTPGEMAAQEARLEGEKAMSKKKKKKKGKKAAAEEPKKKKGKKKASAPPSAPKKKKKKGKGKKAAGSKKSSGSKKSGKKKGASTAPDGRVKLSGNRYTAGPKEVTPEKMAQSLERVELGLPFDLRVGMELIQEKREGEAISIKITSTGWKYKGKYFSSLSGACMYATRRPCSGNDVFNFEKRRNILVRGKKVPRGEFRPSDD